jgi:hypothetical protein
MGNFKRQKSTNKLEDAPLQCKNDTKQQSAIFGNMAGVLVDPQPQKRSNWPAEWTVVGFPRNRSSTEASVYRQPFISCMEVYPDGS